MQLTSLYIYKQKKTMCSAVFWFWWRMAFYMEWWAQSTKIF